MQVLWGRRKYAIIPVEDYQRDRLVVSMAYGHLYKAIASIFAKLHCYVPVKLQL